MEEGEEIGCYGRLHSTEKTIEKGGTFLVIFNPHNLNLFIN